MTAKKARLIAILTRPNSTTTMKMASKKTMTMTKTIAWKSLSQMAKKPNEPKICEKCATTKKRNSTRASRSERSSTK